MIYQYQHFGISESFHKEYGQDFQFPSHLHQSFEFITPLSGSMDIVVDGVEYIVEKGQALMIFPNQIHSLKKCKSSHMLCIFSPNLVSAFTANIAGKLPISNIFTPTKSAIDALDKISEDDSKIRQKSILYALCADFDEQATYREQGRQYNDILRHIFTFVDKNFSNDCSLMTLAEKTPYSYSYLSRYFKQTIGMSYNTYVNQFRVSKACYYLSNSDISILDCALKVGYTSLRSFNRNFKMITGKTPKETR